MSDWFKKSSGKSTADTKSKPAKDDLDDDEGMGVQRFVFTVATSDCLCDGSMDMDRWIGSTDRID